jgi:hypothetical protein
MYMGEEEKLTIEFMYRIKHKTRIQTHNAHESAFCNVRGTKIHYACSAHRKKHKNYFPSPPHFLAKNIAISNKRGETR